MYLFWTGLTDLLALSQRKAEYVQDEASSQPQDVIPCVWIRGWHMDQIQPAQGAKNCVCIFNGLGEEKKKEYMTET